VNAITANSFQPDRI